MTIASIQTGPFTPLKPLPIPHSGCPRVQKVVAIAFSLVGGGSMGALFGGTAVTLLSGVVSPLGAVGGAIAGVMVALFLSIFPQITAPIVAYRQETLSLIDGAGASQNFKEGIRLAKELFALPIYRFSQTYHSHLLYKALIAIADGIEKSRTDALEVFGSFLKQLDGAKVLHPDGTEVTLSMKQVFDRLEGKRPSISLSQLSSWSPYFSSTCQAIEQLQTLSFGEPYTFSASELAKELSADWTNSCYTVWDKEQGSLLGFGWARMQEENGEKIYQVSGIARRPEAAGLGIGSTILTHLINRVGVGTKVRLFIRKSNPASSFYKTLGFKVIAERKDHYPLMPKESALQLELDWGKYRAYRERNEKGSA